MLCKKFQLYQAVIRGAKNNISSDWTIMCHNNPGLDIKLYFEYRVDLENSFLIEKNIICLTLSACGAIWVRMILTSKVYPRTERIKTL